MVRMVCIVVGALLVLAVGTALWLAVGVKRVPLLGDDESARLDAALPSDTTQGNRVETFTSCAVAFERLRADVEGAQQHVHMQFFKFEDDTTGRELADLLGNCAAAGVETRLLYDDFVCRGWRRLYRRLRMQGVETAGFAPVRWPLLHKEDYYRNHRKMVVVDGRVAWLGGANVADRYRYGLGWGCWRDTAVRIEGPAVAAVQRCFAADWHYATGRLLDGAEYYPPQLPAGTLPVRVVPSGPIGEGPDIMHLTADVLRHAVRYAWFESPYFIPPAEVRHELLAAAARGVDVRVALPPRGDRGELTQLASKSFFAEALAAGVRIGLYKPGYMHSKIVVCDDRVAMVGSCNIDPRSYLLCQEVMAVVDDASYAATLRQVFADDWACCHVVDPQRWKQRPLRQKIKERTARLLASQL